MDNKGRLRYNHIINDGAASAARRAEMATFDNSAQIAHQKLCGNTTPTPFSLELDLPVLKGSQAQIDWAADLRLKTISGVVADPRVAKMAEADARWPRLVVAIQAEITARDTARVWIDLAKADVAHASAQLLRAAIGRVLGR